MLVGVMRAPDLQDAALHIVLEQLTVHDIATAALCCKQFKAVASSVLRAQIKDLSRGRDLHPVPCLNDWDDERLPRGFVYHSAVQKNQVVVADARCECLGDCSTAACSCSHALVKPRCSSLEVPEFIKECGPACLCASSCINRVTQRGVAINLALVRSPKGWGVQARQDVARGTFVCEYVGELITTAEAKLRLAKYDQQTAWQRQSSPGSPALHGWSGHALLVVRQELPSGLILRSNIDATHEGNVARFFNHSCDGGNLDLVLVHRRGHLLPAVALVANQHIHSGEELTFSYGLPNGVDHPAAQRCLCGKTSCLGWLPREAV